MHHRAEAVLKVGTQEGVSCLWQAARGETLQPPKLGGAQKYTLAWPKEI